MLEGPDRPGPPRPSIRAPRATGDDDWDDDRDDDLGEATQAFSAYVDTGHDPGPQDPGEQDPGEQDPGEQDRGERGPAVYQGGDPTEPAPRSPRAAPPGPPRPPGPGRSGRVPRAVLLKHRRRRRRFIIGLTFFLSITVTLMGTGYVYLQYRIGQIPRVDVPSLVRDDPDGVMNVLLVGSDSRAGLEGEAARQAGNVSGQRSDTIMVLHIDPELEQAAILSIPRDLYLPIAGEGYSDRVNAAFAVGGPQGLSATIQQSLGIIINHYVEVDFVGFKDIVDAVGGVELYLPAEARDFTSGLNLPQVGCVNVNGTQGLAWVRSREFELLVDGVWIPDPRADLGRIERQQDFIRRMLKKALSSGLTSPLQLNRLIGIGVRDVTLDETLSTKDITTLAGRFNNLDPNSMALLTLPTTPAEIDGKSVLQLKMEEAKPYIDRINGITGPGPSLPSPVDATTTTLSPESLLFPADVDIRVLNGEGTPGTAARAATALQEVGFTVAGTGDATEIPLTTIRHGADALVPAQLLEQALVGGAELVVDATVTSTDLLLVLGDDYQGVRPGPVTPVPRPAAPNPAAPDPAAPNPSTTVTTVGTGTGSTTSTVATTTTGPPTTLGPTTLPPGVEC